MPTAAEPVLPEKLPAKLMMVVSSVAITSTVWPVPGVQPNPGCWFTCAPAPMNACVVIEKTSTMTEPVTAGSPDAAPAPTATDETAGRWMYLRRGWLPTDVPEASVPVTACEFTGIEVAPVSASEATVNSQAVTG